jgi:pimeloyl-ACP methyl ester carboxylesterase
MPGDNVPTYHLHGSKDHVIPAKRIDVTSMVHGGGHILPLSHPGVVSDFIRRYAR